MNEWMNQSMNQRWMNEWMNDWMNQFIESIWINESMTVPFTILFLSTCSLNNKVIICILIDIFFSYISTFCANIFLVFEMIRVVLRNRNVIRKPEGFHKTQQERHWNHSEYNSRQINTCVHNLNVQNIAIIISL